MSFLLAFFSLLGGDGGLVEGDGRRERDGLRWDDFKLGISPKCTNYTRVRTTINF